LRKPVPWRDDGGVVVGGAVVNNNGTYDQSTVSGQAITVHSDMERGEGVPTKINTGSVASVEVVEMFAQNSGAKNLCCSELQ
jgi:hypothetical protein